MFAMFASSTSPKVELFLKYDDPLSNSIQFSLCHQSYPFLHNVKVRVFPGQPAIVIAADTFFSPLKAASQWFEFQFLSFV